MTAETVPKMTLREQIRVDEDDIITDFLENPVEAPRGHEWTVDRSCRGVEAFTSDSKSLVERKALMQICLGCTVAKQCLAYALEMGDNYGMYGGLTAGARVRLKRALKAQQ